MSSIYKQGIYPHISLRSGAEWGVEVNTQILVLWKSHINTEVVKVGVEKAISLPVIFFVVDPFFS